MTDAAFNRALEAVRNEPTKRETYYAALMAVADAGDDGIGRFELEDVMAAVPESRTVFQPMGTLVDVLVKAGAVNEVLPEEEFDEETQESFVDPEKIRYFANEAGLRVLDVLDPENRFEQLVSQNPEYQGTFLKVLEFCAAEPRTRSDIEALLDEECKSAPNPEHRAQQGLYPSFFTDRLQGAGVISWDNGWTTTEAGKRSLAVYR